jgi:hypothetical protein
MFGGLTTLVAAEATSAVRQHVRAAAWLAVGGVFAIGAMACATVALHQWLSTFMPGLQATLWLAGGYGAVAAVFMIVGVWVKNAKRERSALNLTALALAPTAAKFALGRVNLTTVGIGGIIALGALLGRKLGK